MPGGSAGDLNGEQRVLRRSSSLSSEGSTGSVQKRRFLKLGPVHFGGDGMGDWSEEVLEE